jgi:hypothetical protein
MSDISIDNHDLTGRIVIPGRTPEFIGSYSVVYNGRLNEQRVRQVNVYSGYLLRLPACRQVAVKIIRSVGALHTMRRVWFLTCWFTYKARKLTAYAESIARTNGLGSIGPPEYPPLLWACRRLRIRAFWRLCLTCEYTENSMVQLRLTEMPSGVPTAMLDDSWNDMVPL